jgi:hypothetical protein
MVRIADLSKDIEIMTYLETHSYTEAQQTFNLSRMQVSRIKKRNSEAQPVEKPVSLKEKQPKTPVIAPPKEPKVVSNTPNEEESKPEVKMTIDGLRGIKLLATDQGDKLSDKVTLAQEIKQLLSTPKGFAHFNKNLMNYLETI